MTIVSKWMLDTHEWSGPLLWIFQNYSNLKSELQSNRHYPHFWIYVITIWKCHVTLECIHIMALGAEICLPLEGRFGEWSLKSFSVMLHAFIHLCLITWVVSFGDFRSQQMLLNRCRWPLGQVIPLQTVQRVQNIKSHTEKETLW